MENILNPTAGKQRLEATHFIEQYCPINNIGRSVSFTTAVSINLLEEYLQKTNSLTNIHTIAIFKIKRK